MIERVSQEIAQSDEHSYRRLVLVVAHQTDNAVQRVEEKVWVQLHSQRFELRLCELCFETRGEKLALAILTIVVERITDPDHASIDQQIGAELTGRAGDEAWPESLGTVTHFVKGFNA